MPEQPTPTIEELTNKVKALEHMLVALVRGACEVSGDSGKKVVDLAIADMEDFEQALNVYERLALRDLRLYVGNRSGHYEDPPTD